MDDNEEDGLGMAQFLQTDERHQKERAIRSFHKLFPVPDGTLPKGSAPLEFGNASEGCGPVDHRALNTAITDPLSILYITKTKLQGAKAAVEFANEAEIKETSK